MTRETKPFAPSLIEFRLYKNPINPSEPELAIWGEVDGQVVPLIHFPFHEAVRFAYNLGKALTDYHSARKPPSRGPMARLRRWLGR